MKMAFMGAEIIRLVSRRMPQARKGFMGRVWTALLMMLLALAALRSFIPIVTFLRQEVVPHLRDSTLAVFNTQALLFLLLNSMIFAVLAPSGLFNDKSPHGSALEFSDESTATSPSPAASSAAPDSDESAVRPSIPQEVPDPPPVAKPEAEMDVTVQKRERRVRSTDGSPPKARVKRKRSTVQRSQSVKQQITVGIVENGDLAAGNLLESKRDQPDSLKDEDFKELIDKFIARAHGEILRQEREYALSSRTI